MKTITEVAGRLRSTKAPWVAALPSEKWPPLQRLLSRDPDLRVVELEGKEAETTSSLFTQFATRLCFPEYFGRNGDAFEECLRDLEWLPARGYVLAIANAESLLSQDSRDYDTFVDTMQTAGAEWATRRGSDASGTPFHVILLVRDNRHGPHRRNIPELLSASA